MASRRRSRAIITGAVIACFLLIAFFDARHQSSSVSGVAEAEKAHHTAQEVNQSVRILNDRTKATFSGTSLVDTAVQNTVAFVSKAAQRRKDEAFLRLLAEKVDSAVASKDHVLVTFTTMAAARSAASILENDAVESIIRTIDTAGKATVYEVWISSDDRRKVSGGTREKLKNLQLGVHG